MIPDFPRIKRLPPYVFEEVNRLKARLRGQGVDIIDFGMGNPDMPTPKHIVEAGKAALDQGFTHYGPTQGLPELRTAIATCGAA